MNTLFDYNNPDPGKQDALKKTLLKEHHRLYGSSPSFFETYKQVLFAPLYAALFVIIGVGSLITVRAFQSPIANVYGELYGVVARLEVGVQLVLADIHLTSSPLLPGLSAMETTSFAESTDLQQKAYLASKISRALPPSLQQKVTIPITTPQVTTLKNNTTLRLEITGAKNSSLSWEEQLLPSGALPKSYLIERSTDNGMTWKVLNEQTDTHFTDQSAPTSGTVLYRIHIQDWQGNTLPEVLTTSKDLSITSPTPATPIAPITTSEQQITPKPTTPNYDFKDEAQPLLDLHLQAVPVIGSTHRFKISWNTASVASTRGYNLYRDNLQRNVSILRSTTYTDTEILPGKTYQYQVRVIGNDGTEIGKTEKISLTFPFIPQAPSDIDASLSGTSIVIKWKASPSIDFKEYILHRKNLTTGEVTSLHSSQTSYSDHSVDPDTTYQYSVSVLLKNGIESPESITTQITSP